MWRIAWPLAAVLSLAGLHGRLCAFPNRYATKPCSLIPHPTKPCQLSSKVFDIPGYNDTAVPGRVPVYLGELDCEVSLVNCKPNLCYSFADAGDALTPMDPLLYRVCIDQGCALLGNATAQPPATYSVFSELRVTAGAKEAAFNRYGIGFRPSASAVVLRYSTHTCGDFYAARGRQEQQLCASPIPAITVVDVELANGVPCDCTGQPSCQTAL